MTFSIVARLDDGVPGIDGPAWGVAVASKFLAAGAVVPSAWAGTGAVASQAFANLRYHDQARALLTDGLSAPEVVAALTAGDDLAAQRQVGVVDAEGGSASFTGVECGDWAGGLTGEGYSIQGNMLTGADVVPAMEQAWLAHGDLPLSRRLAAALLAGDRAGGDRRGRQSAALLVVAPGAGYGGGSDVAVDLRVDDHRDPVVELERLLGIHELLFGRPETTWPLEGKIADRLRAALDALGYRQGDLEVALNAAAGVENLEERIVPGAVDPVVLDYLEARAAGNDDDSDYMDR